jgi:hypothetical protein
MRAAQAAGPSGPAAGGTGSTPQTLVEALRPFIGLWVAVRGDEVLVAASSPKGGRGLAGPARPARAVDVPGPGL